MEADVLTRARELRKRGAYAEALACLHDAGAPAAAERTRALLCLGRLSEARAEAEHLRGGEADRAAMAERRAAWCDVALALGDISGAWVEAEALLEEARTSGVEAHRDVALALDRLAGVRIAGGALAEALGLSERAVAISEVIVGRPEEQGGLSAFEDADVRHTRAEVLHRLGRFDEARRAWREVLNRRRSCLNLDHPDIAATEDALGVTLCRLGEPHRALRHHDAARPVWQALGVSHPGLAANHHARGQALRRLGRLRDARDALLTAVEATERCVGPDHPDAWISRFELGHVELDLGDVAEGMARMYAALAAAEARLGPLHPTVTAMRRWV